MSLSPETRKKAVEAFKAELLIAIQELRAVINEGKVEWNGEANKMLLHKLKGGASFLGYQHLSLSIADLHKKALEYKPDQSKYWLDALNTWEYQINELS